MSNELNTQLYEKMEAKQQQYREWLLTQPPDEILNHTYEYTMRQDILMAMEEMDLSDKQARTLLKSPCPLADVCVSDSLRSTALFHELYFVLLS